MAKKKNTPVVDEAPKTAAVKGDESHTVETKRTEAAAQKNEKRAKEELKKTVASIGGDVTIVEIDNSKNKPVSEAEQRMIEGQKSAKEQQKAARAAEKKAEKDA